MLTKESLIYEYYNTDEIYSSASKRPKRNNAGPINAQAQVPL